MRALLFLSFLLISHPCLAESVTKTKTSLEDIEKKVAAEKAAQEKLGTQVQTIEKDLKGLKTELIQTTEKVQKNEKDMQSLEGKLSDLTAQKKKLTESLDTERQSLAGLIIAMERIKRVPPQALIARPGAPLETAQAAIVFKAIVPEINARAERLKDNLKELENVEADLKDNKQELDKTVEKLTGNREKMEGLLAARQDAFKETKAQYENQGQQVLALSRQASDLKDLIGKLEEENRRREAKRAEDRRKAEEKARKQEEAARKEALKKGEKSGEAPKPYIKPQPSPAMRETDTASLPALGNARPPLSGPVLVRYGQADKIGAKSEGVRIQGRKGAAVVAPIGGIVRYAGQFKSYGNIVLIEHKNNFHSLIAGLGRIDTVVGQSVDAGEPVGALGSGTSGAPVLYYELRYNGKPVNPARKVAELG